MHAAPDCPFVAHLAVPAPGLLLPPHPPDGDSRHRGGAAAAHSCIRDPIGVCCGHENGDGGTENRESPGHVWEIGSCINLAVTHSTGFQFRSDCVMKMNTDSPGQENERETQSQ